MTFPVDAAAWMRFPSDGRSWTLGQSLLSLPRSRGTGAAGRGSGAGGQRGTGSRSLSVMLGSGCFSHSPCKRVRYRETKLGFWLLGDSMFFLTCKN